MERFLAFVFAGYINICYNIFVVDVGEQNIMSVRNVTYHEQKASVKFRISYAYGL